MRNCWRDANSIVAFTGITGYLLPANEQVAIAALELIDDDNTISFTQNNGNSSNNCKILKLLGAGTLSDGSGKANVSQRDQFVDGSEFRGSITMNDGRCVWFGGTAPSACTAKSIGVGSDATVTVDADKTWTAANGITVNGTLCGAGTLASATTFGEGAKIKPAVGGLKFGSTITSSVTIDCANIVESGVDRSVLITMTGANKTLPSYELENTDGYVVVDKEGVLHLVKKEVYDFYSKWSDTPAILTWKGVNSAFHSGPPAISHRNTRCVALADKDFLVLCR